MKWLERSLLLFIVVVMIVIIIIKFLCNFETNLLWSAQMDKDGGRD